MNVVVDGLLTNYQRAGKGRTAVMLHGWGDSLQTFAAIQKELTKQFDTISLDLPGFGGTQMPDKVWGLDDYAKFVAAFLTKIGVKEVMAIIAHSNGAAVAIKAVASNKLQPSKLVLLGAAGIRNQQKAKRLALKLLTKTGKIATFWLPMRTKQKLQKKLYGTIGSDMLVAPHLKETFKRTVREDVQADASNISVPVMLIYGEKDTATPPMYGEIYRNLIPASELVVISNAAHFVHQDKPDEVLTAIKGFVA